MSDFSWTVRVRTDEQGAVRVHARNHAFPVGPPLSFRPTDTHPSALEMMLGALAADLTAAFRDLARKRSVPVDALELVLSCRLHNPLAALGVIGEEGDPGIAAIAGTLYAASPAEETALAAIWQATLRQSPLVSTLRRATDISLRLEITF